MTGCLADPQEGAERRGLAAEEELLPCDDCLRHFPPDETWQCWYCGTVTCDECKEINGWPCGHFQAERNE